MVRLAKRSDTCVLRARIIYSAKANGLWLHRNRISAKALEVYSVGERFGRPWWLGKMYGQRLPRSPSKTKPAETPRREPRSQEDVPLHNQRRGWWFKRRWGVDGVPLGSLKEGHEYWLAITSPGSVSSSIRHAEPVKR
jgi:hypothetical protein